MLGIPPYVCRRGKNHFDPGGSHDFVPPPQISWYYVVISQNYSHIMLISPYFPLTPLGDGTYSIFIYDISYLVDMNINPKHKNEAFDVFFTTVVKICHTNV